MDEGSNLLFDLEQLLIVVSPQLTFGVTAEVEELAGTELSTLVQGVHEALHHDNLRLLQMYLLRVGCKVAIESKFDRWRMV